MKRILILLGLTACAALAGCAVVPAGPPARAYVAVPRVAVVVPAPVVVVRPFVRVW